MSDIHTLFVYGSLMRGRSNYPRYMGRSSFLGNAYITGFILYDLGYFPAIKHGEDGGRVLGELYQVGQEDFEAICRLEGNGELYQYEAVTAYPEGGGEAIQAETFVLIPDLTGMGVPRIPEEAQPWRKNSDGQYVWYACYGSNINRNRFMRYITRCTDQTEPREDRPFEFPYSVFFAGSSGIWEGKAPAFLDDTTDGHAFGRVYKITEAQYQEVKMQEGPKYRKKVDLGWLEGYPVVSFTCEEKPKRGIPSGGYLDVILQGLQETYPGRPESEVARDLVLGIFSEEELAVLACLRSAEHGLTNQEISERTGLAMEREAALITILDELGVIRQDRRSLAFAPTDSRAVYYTERDSRYVVDKAIEIVGISGE